MLNGYNREKGKIGRTRVEGRGKGRNGEWECEAWEEDGVSEGTRAFDQRQSARAHVGLSEENIKDPEGLKLGERAALRVAAVSLQSKAGGGPLVPVSPWPSATHEDSGRGVVDDIAQRLEGLGIGSGGSRNATQDEPSLKIVDFFVSDTAGRRRGGTQGRGDVENKL